MKKLSLLLALLIIMTGTVSAGSAAPVRVAASFYPIYVIAQNVLADVEGVELYQLAQKNTGCLHDYQLLTSDMKALAEARALLVNGAGMESFLGQVHEQLTDLKIIDSSEGIELLPSADDDEEAEEDDHDHDADDGHDAEHDHDDEHDAVEEAVREQNASRGHKHPRHHHHGDFNSHIWLDPANAAQMAKNMAKGLQDILPDAAEKMNANAEAFSEKMAKLSSDMSEGLKNVKSRDIVTFHEAFPYFAKAFSLNTVAVIALEPDEPLPPALLKNVIKKVRSAGNPPLFTEPQYSAEAANIVSNETGAPIYELDPAVTGDGSADSYENAMRKNLDVLVEALNK